MSRAPLVRGLHCAGVWKHDENTLVLSDGSYSNKVRIALQGFVAIVKDFDARPGAAKPVFFALIVGACKPIAMDALFSLSAGVDGPSKGRKRRPFEDKPGESGTVVCTNLTKCVVCDSPLFLNKDERAYQDCRVVTTNGLVRVEHWRKRCSSKSCRIYHAHNFYYSQGQKLNFAKTLADFGGAIVVSSNLGFSVA